MSLVCVKIGPPKKPSYAHPLETYDSPLDVFRVAMRFSLAVPLALRPVRSGAAWRGPRPTGQQANRPTGPWMLYIYIYIYIYIYLSTYLHIYISVIISIYLDRDLFGACTPHSWVCKTTMFLASTLLRAVCCLHFSVLCVLLVIVIVNRVGGWGWGWGGVLTFFATARFSCTSTHTSCYATASFSCAFTHTSCDATARFLLHLHTYVMLSYC